MGFEVEYGWRPECVARHLGLWAIEPLYLQRQLALMRQGLLPPASKAEQQTVALAGTSRPYQVDPGGVAVIPISGALVKRSMKYGTDPQRVQRALRAAVRDEEVKSIMLLIDSPGGTVAGTEELAADVRDAAAEKPVFAHLDDLGASAAYWIAAQAGGPQGEGQITANATAEIGSIGVLAVVEDSSGMAQAEGITVHVLSTGPFKGVGVEGAPVSEEHLAYLQGLVDAAGAQFREAVRRGRRVSEKKVADWASGKVWPAAEAASMGLIDGVMRLDKAMEMARKAGARKANRAATRAAILRAQIAAAE